MKATISDIRKKVQWCSMKIYIGPGIELKDLASLLRKVWADFQIINSFKSIILLPEFVAASFNIMKNPS